MKTPREKYMNDPEYNALVTTLESFIERAQFSPSELREAAVLACINYEMRHVRNVVAEYHPRVKDALRTLDELWVSRPPRR
jgi:hypothetical protein